MSSRERNYNPPEYLPLIYVEMLYSRKRWLPATQLLPAPQQSRRKGHGQHVNRFPGSPHMQACNELLPSLPRDRGSWTRWPLEVPSNWKSSVLSQDRPALRLLLGEHVSTEHLYSNKHTGTARHDNHPARVCCLLAVQHAG